MFREKLRALSFRLRKISPLQREDYQFDSLIYLLGTLAHEIKNPLGGIKGAAQLLREKTQTEGIGEYTNLIIKRNGQVEFSATELSDNLQKTVIPSA